MHLKECHNRRILNKKPKLPKNIMGDVGRAAMKDIVGSFEFNMRPEAIFESSDVTTLMVLADLKHGCPEKVDDEGRVPSFITPRRIVLPSADTVLEAVNRTDLPIIEKSFRTLLNSQLLETSKMLPQQLIIAGDGHDVLRYSKLNIAGHGKKRKRKAGDIKMVVGTKPETTPWAHRFITLCSCNTAHTLDMEPQLPLQQLPALAEGMLERTETALNRKTDILLWDTAAYSAGFAAMMRKRGTHFIVRAPKNSVVKKWLKTLKGRYGGVMRHCIDGNADAPASLMAISTALLKSNGMRMVLVDRKEKWVTLATDLEPFAGEKPLEYLLRIARLYKRRWHVETSYRCIEEFHGLTHSLHYQVRYLLFALAVLLYNIWASRLRPIGAPGRSLSFSLIGILQPDAVEIGAWIIAQSVPDALLEAG
jgi:hypothetical protein